MYSPKTKCPTCGASRDYLKVTKDGLMCLVCSLKWKAEKKKKWRERDGGVY